MSSLNPNPHNEIAADKLRLPDYEVLRCIGRGAYGEVWMARSVTGMFRAIKVVRRSNFEVTRTFEREFEGIREFEPISRGHVGLIDILHVGRINKEGIFYYVMEIADDCQTGREIDPAAYDPHTLSAWRRRQSKADLDACLIYGRKLAEALGYLHGLGLAHRDVKPSNVIFVHGEPKLADVGLVARSGQRSFVGTEGFVPPEGPGSPAADLYSLGMVLYEISTGRDRLDFPELPTQTLDTGRWEQWQQINRIICRAVANDPAKRYANGEELAKALDAASVESTGESKLPGSRRRNWLSGACALVMTGLLIGAVALWGPGSKPSVARASFQSDPEGAKVIIGGEVRGVTPLRLDDLPVGTVEVRMQLDKHRAVERKVRFSAGENPEIKEVLARWNPPVPGKPWVNSIGMEFAPDGDRHRAVLPTSYQHYIASTDNTLPEGEVLPVTLPGKPDTVYHTVFVPPEDAREFCRWLHQRDSEAGYVDKDYAYGLEPYESGIEPTVTSDTNDHLAFRCQIWRRVYGEMALESDPPGAEILWNGEVMGRTPLTATRVETGDHRLSLRLDGFQDAEITLTVEEGALASEKVILKEDRTLVFGKPWENSLGMRFVPLPEGPMFCVWETRLADYEVFVSETSREPVHRVDFDQGPDHPVVQVIRGEARAFCEWLTDRERKSGLLTGAHVYSLPSDLEWSRAVGLSRERGNDPDARHVRVRGIYPWGIEWPPPVKSGNFSDKQALEVGSRRRGKTLARFGYADGNGFTAPVGSYPPNQFGLYDLAGNAWEWVEDDFGGKSERLSRYGVARGGSWGNYTKEKLLSSYRNVIPAGIKDTIYGFRCVLRQRPR